MNTTDKMLLKDAGYREKAFAKARLAQLGQVSEFHLYLRNRNYDAHRDTIDGLGKVQWEGSQSREILAQHGQDDSGCGGSSDERQVEE